MSGHRGPRSVAVVGAGPAGLYLLAALLKSDAVDHIDVFDAAPAPFGLIRYGVAPDHPRTRAIADVLTVAFDDDRARYLGNVTVGTDISVDELRAAYDAVVLSTGMRGDRPLGIEGEHLAGSIGASGLVDWYTGHPDVGPCPLPEELRAAVVVGAGNVALDVARILTRPADALAGTSMPRHVVTTLRASALTDIHILARRGPAFAKFTSPELHEIGALDDVGIVVDPADLVLDADDDAALAARRPARVTVKVLHEWLGRPPTGAPRRIHFHFWRRPVRIRGGSPGDAPAGGRVTGVDTEATRGDPAPRTIDAQLVVRAIGYSGQPIPGVPWDDHAGVVPSDGGRVVGADGTITAGLYVTGWMRRGPTGVIGTNRPDASEVAGNVLADLDGYHRVAGDTGTPDVDTTLKERGVRVVSWDDWLRLDAYEHDLGTLHGSDPIAVHDLADMLSHAFGEA